MGTYELENKVSNYKKIISDMKSKKTNITNSINNYSSIYSMYNMLYDVCNDKKSFEGKYADAIMKHLEDMKTYLNTYEQNVKDVIAGIDAQVSLLESKCELLGSEIERIKLEEHNKK